MVVFQFVSVDPEPMLEAAILGFVPEDTIDEKAVVLSLEVLYISQVKFPVTLPVSLQAHAVIEHVARVVARDELDQPPRENTRAVQFAEIRHHLIERRHAARGGIAAAAGHTRAAKRRGVFVF